MTRVVFLNIGLCLSPAPESPLVSHPIQTAQGMPTLSALLSHCPWLLLPTPHSAPSHPRAFALAIPLLGTIFLRYTHSSLPHCNRPLCKSPLIRGTWVTQSVKRPTSAQVMISQFVSSSPMSGSVLTAQNLEPASDSVSPLSTPLCSCSVSQK